ncbi:MAG: hypothetical protein NT139_03240 [Candidatus Woesearchaeota archaeon]|nr:hypothetical protein [Candidatus Woesearchaeota archaeon]
MQQKYTLPQTIIERINELKRIVTDSYENTRYKLIAQALILASGQIKKEFNDQYLYPQNRDIHAKEMIKASEILEKITNDSKMFGGEHLSQNLEQNIEMLKEKFSEDMKLPRGNIYVLTRLLLLKGSRNEIYKKIGETIEKVLFSDYSFSFYKPFRNKLNQIPKDDNIQKKEELINKQLLIEEKLIREDGLRNLL